jgi:hypothetical protein
MHALEYAAALPVAASLAPFEDERPLRPGERRDPSNGLVCYSAAWLNESREPKSLYDVRMLARRLPARGRFDLVATLRVEAESPRDAVLAAARELLSGSAAS